MTHSLGFLPEIFITEILRILDQATQFLRKFFSTFFLCQIPKCFCDMHIVFIQHHCSFHSITGSTATLIIGQFIFSTSFQRYDVVNCHLFIDYFYSTDLTNSMVFSVNHASFSFFNAFPFCVHVILSVLPSNIYTSQI